MERKTPSPSKSPEKQHSSKKNVVGTSRPTESSKGKAYKRMLYCEESSSDELVNADESRFQHTQLYSRATGGENSGEEVPRKFKRPSYKSPEKQQSLKKNVEETSRRTESSKGKAYKRINYCENSSEESVNEDASRIHLYSRATGGDNRIKEALDSLSYNIVSDSKDSSSNDLCIDVVERDTKHNMLDADKFLKESPSSATLSDRRDLSESGKVFPYLFWGKNAEAIRHSEGDDGTEVENGASARKLRKEVNKNNVDKEWKRYKGLMKQSKKRESSRSKIEDVEAGSSSSFHYERKDAFKSIKPISHSGGDVEPKKDGTEIEDGACARNDPKLSNKDNLKKEVEKCKFLKKLEENKEVSRCKIDDAEDADKKVPTSEGSNENITDLKFSPVTAENKGVLKRQSDPSNALKENRPRPSL